MLTVKARSTRVLAQIRTIGLSAAVILCVLGAEGKAAEIEFLDWKPTQAYLMRFGQKQPPPFTAKVGETVKFVCEWTATVTKTNTFTHDVRPYTGFGPATTATSPGSEYFGFSNEVYKANNKTYPAGYAGHDFDGAANYQWTPNSEGEQFLQCTVAPPIAKGSGNPTAEDPGHETNNSKIIAVKVGPGTEWPTAGNTWEVINPLPGEKFIADTGTMTVGVRIGNEVYAKKVQANVKPLNVVLRKSDDWTAAEKVYQTQFSRGLISPSNPDYGTSAHFGTQIPTSLLKPGGAWEVKVCFPDGSGCTGAVKFVAAWTLPDWQKPGSGPPSFADSRAAIARGGVKAQTGAAVAAQRPDLVVSSISFDVVRNTASGTGKACQAYNLSATVKNQGQGDAGAFNVLIERSRGANGAFEAACPECLVPVAGLARGESMKLDGRTFDNCGDRNWNKFRVTADPAFPAGTQEKVSESNEGNNSMTKAFSAELPPRPVRRKN